MIFDELSNVSLYKNFLPPNLSEALAWIEENINELPEDGKYALNDDDFVIIQTYETRPIEGSELENHHKYIDIQVVVEGDEWIFHDKLDTERRTKEYADDEDIEFFNMNDVSQTTKLVFKKGYFAIFWPGDCHIPCISPEKTSRVRKIVAKILVKE